MDIIKTLDDHVLVTPPDRYWEESYSILLIDFEWGLAETIINTLRSSSIKLSIHVYTVTNSDPKWLLDVAATANCVLMDLTQITNNDVLKGQLISKHNVWYVGRRDLETFWPRYTNDPIGMLLVNINQYQTTRGNQ